MISKHAVGCVAVLLALSVRGYAQEQTFSGPITSGTLTVWIVGTSAEIVGEYDLGGPGFHIVATRADEGANSQYFRNCTGTYCQPGDTVDLSASFVGLNDLGLGFGIATINGQTFSPVQMTGNLDAVAGQATIPRGFRKAVVVSAPFTLTGRLLVLDGENPDLDRPLALGDLTGSGTATMFLERIRDGRLRGYVARKIVFSFGAPQ